MIVDFQKLLDSVCFYLSYQEKIGRKFMVNESSLKFPVIDYLSGLEMPLSQFILEFNHPSLKNRAIDLVISGSSEFTSKAFEFKLAQNYTKYENEKQRIFNDLIRLHLFSGHTKGNGYFIIVGTKADFTQNFRNIKASNGEPRPKDNSKQEISSPEGFFTEWFDFIKGGLKQIDFKEFRSFTDKFRGDYQPSDDNSTLNLPTGLQTTCMAISALSRDFPSPFVGGIWKVE